MTCAEARDALLTADLAELDRDGTGPLAEHLATCRSCHAAADRIAAITRALEAERALPPSRPPARAAAIARAEADRLRRARQVRRAVLPLVAAAGLAAVMLLRQEPEAGRPLTPPPPLSPPLVESAAGRVAVLTTDNPNIVVVWQF
jgi:predicted anti-sigma-YlaC factor YlaD